MDEFFFICVVPPLRVFGMSDMQRWSDYGFKRRENESLPFFRDSANPGSSPAKPFPWKKPLGLEMT